MSKPILLISVQTLKDRSAVYSNDDDKLIAAEIKAAQDIHLIEALGSALFERLQQGVLNENLNADELKLLDEYITDVLIYYTLAELPIPSSLQFSSKGMLRPSNDGSELPSMDDMYRVSRRYEKKGAFYRERLIRYIRENATLFPLYGCRTDQDIRPIKSSYRLPVWLGDDDDCC